MKLIVGLGNPGDNYLKTRHNLGFMTVDKLCQDWSVRLKPEKKLKSEFAVTMRHGGTILIAKPQTFMNDSGLAVAKIASFYKLDPADVWVVSDDADLEFGKIRLRVGGSSGGHNGLESIISQIGEQFVRVRVGVSNDKRPQIDAADFVLQKFTRAEQAALPKVIEQAAQLIEKSLQEGAEHVSTKA